MKVRHIISEHDLPLTEQELLEMANVDYQTTGIPNVVMWVGPHPGKHWMRIKVSNVPDKYSPNDSFTITIPDLKIAGKVNDYLITQEIFEDIKTWIRLNYAAIEQYSKYEISTKRLFELLKPI